MFDFTDEQKMVRRMLRKWAEERLAPAIDNLEEGRELPFGLMRDFIQTFGVADMARSALEKLEARGEASAATATDEPARDAGMNALVGIELSRLSPGFALSFGASLGLCGGAIMRKGSLRQKRELGLPVLTGEKIGAWALTEPHAGSDAFGGMRTTARRVDEGYVLSGQKTFITNAPYADTLLVYAKLTEGDAPLRDRPIHAFIVERGAAGLTLSAPMKKMGMRASPTGEVFLDEVMVPEASLLGERTREPSREGAKDVFHSERTGMVPMALGIIERCLEIALDHAKERTAWERPIADYQLVQAKLARMYVHHQNVKNLLFKTLWMARKGIRMTMGEASAMKAYCAPAATECAMEAVQILGGTGYMQAARVEQLARDAKLLQIGGGTDEIQQITCARALLQGDMVL
jgi:alkylation response protein AidB-like acyl-CoA dehydrogenase